MNKNITVKQLNAALAAAGIAHAEVSKAEGVWYLVGEAFDGTEETCLHAVRLSDLTPEGVVAEARRVIAAQHRFD